MLESILDKENFHSFVMMGQSNMAGRGEFDEVKRIANSSCYMFRMASWQFMSEPINVDRDIFKKTFHSGISLGASFVDDYNKYYKIDVGVIPCANGDTRIDMWAEGEALFDHAVMQTKLASRTSTLKGVLWHQGESDSVKVDDINAYIYKFEKMVTAFRKQVENTHLPFFVGEISTNISQKWNIPKENAELFNSKLKEITQKIENVYLVKASDLPLQNDGIHFCSKSLRTLGSRYFEAYKQYNENK